MKGKGRTFDLETTLYAGGWSLSRSVDHLPWERDPRYVLVGFMLSRKPSGPRDGMEDLKGSTLSRTPVQYIVTNIKLGLRKRWLCKRDVYSTVSAALPMADFGINSSESSSGE